MARSASFVKESFTFSISKSFWYCFISAFFGWVRMVTRSSSVRSVSVAMIGQAADELGDHPELHQVLRLDRARAARPRVRLLLALDLRAEAEPLHAHAAPDDLLDAAEGAAAR